MGTFLILWIVGSYIYCFITNDPHYTDSGRKTLGVGFFFKFLIIGIGGVVFWVFVGSTLHLF